MLIRALSLAQGDRGKKGPVLAGNKQQDREGVGLIEKGIRGGSRQGVGMEVGRDGQVSEGRRGGGACQMQKVGEVGKRQGPHEELAVCSDREAFQVEKLKHLNRRAGRSMLGVKPVTVFLAPPAPIGHHFVALRLACQVIYTKGPGHPDLLSAFSWVSFAETFKA